MLGTDDDPGIMVRALNDLFFSMEKTSDDMKYKVTMSYLEVCTFTVFIQSKDRVFLFQNNPTKICLSWNLGNYARLI